MENKQIAETKTPIEMAFKIWYIAESRKEPTSEAFKEWKSRGQQLCYEVAYTEGYQDAAEASYEKLSQEKRATAIGFAEWIRTNAYEYYRDAWHEPVEYSKGTLGELVAKSDDDLFNLYLTHLQSQPPKQ